MAGKKVTVNRAPVLTLWATVVAERLGYDRDTALTLGKAVAGLNAQAKGKRLGIYEESQAEDADSNKPTKPVVEHNEITLLGRKVSMVETKQGLRAASKGKAISPQSVDVYLNQKFGADLETVEALMQAVAQSYAPDELASAAYTLYESFRPEIPEGVKGWGAKGELELDRLRGLARHPK